MAKFLFICSLLLASVIADTADDDVWDYAPDFSQDPFPPYPPVKNPDGTNISVTSLRGTKLFGWKGCEPPEQKMIAQAFDDFNTLVNQNGVYKNIDWTSKAATDYWGPASGKNTIPDNTRKEIQQIFAAAQQMYSHWWIGWQPPWLSWRSLWIEVRCSDSKLGPSSSDPNNVCGDGKPDPDNGRCPIGGQPPVGGGTKQLQAFSDNDGKYSMITFCTGFFNLQAFGDAINAGKKLVGKQKTDLSKWDNRARCFLHEVTHLDYFMNTGPGDQGQGPYVWDLELEYGNDWHECYGPYYSKMLRNFVDADPQYSGYFTQRNADNYAWFALALYVQGQINQYPGTPSPGRRKPVSEPRNSATHLAPEGLPSDSQDVDQIPEDGDEPPSTTYPGCPDTYGSDVAAAAVSSSIVAAHASQTAAPPPPPPPPPTTSQKPTGTCCFHLDEWQDCNDDSKNLYANITLYDNTKKVIYQTPENYFAKGGLGEPINVGNKATFQGPLSQPVQVTGEHEKDYIQFTYGSLSWTSRTTSGSANCQNGGWNPRDGPFCALGANIPAENQMDCCFPC